MSNVNFERQDEVYEDAKLLNQSLLESSPRWNSDQPRRNWIRPLLLVLTGICTALASFFAGALFAIRADGSHTAIGLGVGTKAVPRVPIGEVVKTFQLDQSFITVPIRNETEPAWDSLLPNGIGYVSNTPLAEEFSVVSVFHQLHCLYTLRRAYYAEQTADISLEDFDFGHNRMDHVGHCFEYLRQALLCSADSSIEPANRRARGGHEFLGWDVPRQCRNYDQLKQWAEQMRAFDAHGFLANDLRTKGEKER